MQQPCLISQSNIQLNSLAELRVNRFRPQHSFAAGLGMEYKKFSVAGRYYARPSRTDDSKAFGIHFFKT